MTRGAIVTAPERAAWIAGMILVAALIYATDFHSHDPDSALHAGIAARQAQTPVAEWIAPRWWGLWPGSGVNQLYLEHPAGIFVLPATLARLGLPAEPSSYVVGVAASLAALGLAAVLVGRLASIADARAALVLLPLMPVAFIFRIRANHEYPMLVCLLLALVGLDRIRDSWWWTTLVVAGFVGGLLIKGVFVVLVLLAAGLWVVVNPRSDRQARFRPWIAVAIGLVAMAVAAAGYDAWYLSATGVTFWGPYWHRQLGPVTFATPFDNARLLVKHVVFYITRLIWDPAPWSVALAWAALRGWRRATTLEPPTTSSMRRGLLLVIAFASLATLTLSLPSRFAERYTFSPAFLVGIAGVVAGRRVWPSLRHTIDRLDAAIPALPALVWTTLLVLRLGLGPWIPRIQDH